MNRRETLDIDQPEGASDGWLWFHTGQIVDDLVDRYGFARARDMLADMLTSRAGNRPVVIDHIQEPH
jgi:hypothetical protein